MKVRNTLNRPLSLATGEQKDGVAVTVDFGPGESKNLSATEMKSLQVEGHLHAGVLEKEGAAERSAASAPAASARASSKE